MNTKPFLLGIAVGILAMVCAFLMTGKRKQPSGRFTLSMVGANSDLVKHTWQNCPDVAFTFDQDEADYSLGMRWQKDHWDSKLFHKQDYLFAEDSPDFDKLVRDACKAIREDAKWRSPATSATSTAQSSMERYELHDMHNGSISTVALLDKKTGKVWIWTNLTKNGKQTGESAFLSEEVTPEPDSK